MPTVFDNIDNALLPALQNALSASNRADFCVGYFNLRGWKQIDSHIEEFRPSLSKPIIDEIDRVLAKHYGFTDEELDFIINYDIKYRMGADDTEEDAQ